MLTKDSSDKEILDHPLDKAGNLIRNVGGISFTAYLAKKLDGAKTYSAATQELLALVRTPPLGRMLEGEKIKAIRKLISMGIDI